MKKLIEYKGKLVNVMVIDPTGIWAMYRLDGAGSIEPSVARVKDLKNVTEHSMSAGLSCVCQSCIDGRKMGLRPKVRI